MRSKSYLIHSNIQRHKPADSVEERGGGVTFLATPGAMTNSIATSDSAHVLRQRYRAACKDLQRAKRAVHGCLNTRRLPVLKEEFERARLHLEEVESEVKRCW